MSIKRLLIVAGALTLAACSPGSISGLCEPISSDSDEQVCRYATQQVAADSVEVEEP